MEPKAQLRKLHKKIRQQMQGEEVVQLSLQICKHLIEAGKKNRDFYKQQGIYGYYPLKNEVSLVPLYNRILEAGIPLAFPRVQGTGMDFYQIQYLTDLEEGCFHVMEPKQNAKKVHWEQASVLTPGVVFDRAGNRIGYGKGYYDAYFRSHATGTRIGIAYENQIEEVLPIENFDQPVDHLVTEAGIRK